ncbi:Type IV fimbrial biogenesis protein PilY1 [Methylophaga frappieri]|uniref:Type IV fimbrial biogenesis protein PilY1 n=1 Tax=Methylophaga frappieri (strain ATCC BAA-2434 / DSM 25690 / JAM7) TaxID=754477 RepID=I1YKL2_METFJ|nr:PilC/PilY family type IV pilus protein [Methylophaga frappieri]AFJ03455.1 Type IV fimbrial biogenesis protein PilY1 [Methylophaga frappieri]
MAKQSLLISLFTALFLHSTYTAAADLDLANTPLYLGGAIEPNVMFTMDDSGSMQFEMMPESVRGSYANYLFPAPNNVYGSSTYTNQIPNFDDDNFHNYYQRSAANNVIFYNPDIDYEPWRNHDGSLMANANPRQVYYNPLNTGAGSMDLLAQQSQYACWYRAGNLNEAYGDPCWGNHSFWPITYYNYDGTGSRSDRDNYDRVRITSGTSAGTTFSKPSGGSRTRDEEIQNFANWFQYYRSRILLSRAGVGKAFARQSTNMRVGYASINTGSRTIDSVNSSRAILRGLRTFDGNDRRDFFNTYLYGQSIPTSGTPLRTALDNVGKYFERDDNRGPWARTPGTNLNNDHLACRQSFNILMTDGYWNGNSPGVGNSDNNNGSEHSDPEDNVYQYTPTRPYRDDSSNTLADVAMHYWKRDLRADLENQVPISGSNPAFWQHLVNFTVGLGVTGTLNPATDLPALTSGALEWPSPSADSERNIDDLWHAAVNSRGSFFSAADPDQFADALTSILNDISDRTASSSSVALNSGTVSGDARVYQARFDSGNWSGELRSLPITDAGVGAAQWEASSLIPSWNNRNILTWSNGDGERFRWGRLTQTQRDQLGERAILQYVRGNQDVELDKQNGRFRIRSSLLGDIVNSAPQFVGKPSLRYRDYWGEGAAENAEPYSEFKEANANRTPMIYVGANDGMLHAFDADDGSELFNYIPGAVFPRLADLANPNFTHRYFVDGTPTIVDAFIGGQWRSILVSGLGGGGQAMFALDVTNPNDYENEAGGAAQVLWEFSDANDRDLGYTFSRPSIIRLKNGTWAALFTSGYNNTVDNDNNGNGGDSLTGNGVFYLVNIADGSLIKPFDTGVGSQQDPTDNGRPNGLATPSAVDVNGDYITDYIYAGDLFGNLWKLDMTGETADSWDFSSRRNGSPEPVFRACDGNCGANNRQAITGPVNVVRHITGAGSLVMFGTGKYLEVGDNNSVGQTTQSYYAVWDKPETSAEPNPIAFNRSSLLSQTIIDEGTVNGEEYRVTSDNKVNWTTHKGWYMDFNYGGVNNGERQISGSVVTGGRVIFTTLLPSDDPCDFGGDSWVMQLDINSGSRLRFTPFDLNNDGTVDDIKDLYSLNVDPDDPDNPTGYDEDGNCRGTCVSTSGRKSNIGITSTPSVIRTADGQERIILSGSDRGAGGNNIESIVTRPQPGYEGRQSWRQLQFIQ